MPIQHLQQQGHVDVAERQKRIPDHPHLVSVRPVRNPSRTSVQKRFDSPEKRIRPNVGIA